MGKEVTAEVAIMNKWAVALSADSAVTTGQPGREKIFTGANKIFTLSKYAPVGVMIYGHVEHFGVPWEIIIKNYRAELGRKTFSHVLGYVADFERYLTSKKFVTKEQEMLGVLIACSHTSGTINNYLVDHFRRDRWTADRIKIAIEDCHQQLSECDGLKAYSDYTYRSFSRSYSAILDEYVRSDPFDILELPRACALEFKKLVHAHMVCSMSTRFSTGVVIAGFGNDEMFPTLHHMSVDGGVAGRVRIMGRRTTDIARSKDTVFVEAFAQEDAVEAFMNGVDDQYEEFSAGVTEGFVKDHTREMLDEHTSLSNDEKDTIVAMMSRELPKSMAAFRKALGEFSHRNFRSPIEEVLRNAPKDELAHVAESLVNLTSLKRRVSGDLETVAGPVDVAIISKGDGFVWIKRKHYFDPKLNHHFERNYFNEGG